MKWESLILTAFAAGSATARAHDMHRDAYAHLHQKRDTDALIETVWNTKTVVDWDVVTVTVTVDTTTTSTVTTSTTVEVAAASTSSTTSSDAVVSGTISVSVNEDLVVDPATTSTAIESTSTSTSTTIENASSSSPVSTTTTATTIFSTTMSTAVESTSTSSIVSTTTTTVTSSAAASSDWYSTPSDGTYSTSGFGERTNSSGSGIEYTGNVGSPWGSNIIEVSSTDVASYKYVVQVTGSNSADWFVSFWNKIGPDGKMDGWYGHSALNFTLAAGETKYVAFDENSQGGWGAAEGSSLPTDDYGGYACTWGEFDFGDTANSEWSGWDVSAIQAQNADLTVQGMKICTYSGEDCSYITAGAGEVVNAYTAAAAAVDGIGGSVSAGAVRLAVDLDYSG